LYSLACEASSRCLPSSSYHYLPLCLYLYLNIPSFKGHWSSWIWDLQYSSMTSS
jgi:hypothetical protein